MRARSEEQTWWSSGLIQRQFGMLLPAGEHKLSWYVRACVCMSSSLWARAYICLCMGLILKIEALEPEVDIGMQGMGKGLFGERQ